jgi:uncharacterized Zn-finger protein
MAYRYHFCRGCEECGRSVDIDEQICPKCGFDFTLNPRISPKCPYCEKELHLIDFYVTELDKKGYKKYRGFLGEHYEANQMYHCPFCGKILGFSNAAVG